MSSLTMKIARSAARWGLLIPLACCPSSCGSAPREASGPQASDSKAVTVTHGSSTATLAQAPASSAAIGIESFGHSAGRIERAAIVSVLRRYMGALAADDGAGACAHMAAPLKAQAANLGSAQTSGKHQDCAQVVASMFAGQSLQTHHAMRNAVIGAIRVEGTRAFAIFRQKGLPVSFYPLQLEGSQWRVAALGGTALPHPARKARQKH